MAASVDSDQTSRRPREMAGQLAEIAGRTAPARPIRCAQGQGLEQIPAVVDYQTILVDVAAVVGARRDVAQAYAEALERTALHRVAEIQIALEVLALVAWATPVGGLGIDVVALDITHPGDQPWHAHGAEVVVVTQLQGALVGRGELEGRHLVTQRRDVGEYPREGVVAEYRLVAEVECMAAMPGRQQGEQGLVVNCADQLLTILAGVVEAQVGPQHPVAHRLAVLEADKPLVVDVLQLGIPGPDRGAAGVEGIVGTAIVEALAAAGALRQVAEHGQNPGVTGLVAEAG